MRKTAVLLVSLGVTVACATLLRAYVLHDNKWPSATMTFNVDIPGGGGRWNRAFEQAMVRWNQSSVFTFRIRDTYEDPCDTRDGVSGVGFADLHVCGDYFGFGASGDALAVTLTWYRGNTKTESNIHFNTLYDWDIFDGPQPAYPWDPQDFRRVAVHELGHALGLAHEDDVPAIMISAMPPQSTIVRPTADDIAGVHALYATPPPPPAPRNDSFSNAPTISGISGRATGSNVGADTETDERGVGGHSIWWEWRSPANGTLTVDTIGSDFDTTLGVYAGTRIGALRQLAENDDAVGTQSRVTLDVTAGTYYFRVASYGSATGNIVLNWNFEERTAPVSHRYIFPQFAFGGGWESTLMVLGPQNDTSCTFTAEGRYLEMENLRGTELRLSFNNTWSLIRTMPPSSQAASSGMAILNCDKEVMANVLFSLSVDGSVVGEALVEPAQAIVPSETEGLFFSDHRGDSRLALAVANPSSQSLSVRLNLYGGNPATDVIDTTVTVPANSAKAFLLDELGEIPEDHVGLVAIWASSPVYAIGLKTTGRVFTTIPATIIQ